MISSGDCSTKPGWIRMSIHPTHTDEEIEYLCDSIEALAKNFRTWSADDDVDYVHGHIRHRSNDQMEGMMQEVDHILSLEQTPETATG